MKRSVLRIAVQITTVVVLLAAVVLVLGPVRAELERRFEEVKTQAVAELERVIGRRITYGDVSPSVLRYLSVHDLTIHGSADEPADLLTVDQLRVYYRPIRLLQGRYAEAFSELRIENTTLTVDTRLDSDLTALLADLLGSQETAMRESDDAEADSPPENGPAGATLADILPDDLVISGRNIQLSVRSGIGLVEMDRLFFTTSLAEETVSLRWQGEVRLRETPETFPLSDVAGRVEATGTINAATGDTLLEVSLRELTSNLATLQSQVLQVRYADGVLEARNVQSREPVDLYVRYIDADGELYARILADGYRLRDLVQLKGEYELLNRYLALPIRGQANTRVTPDSLSFGGSLLTEIEGISEVPDGELSLQFDGTSGGVSINELAYTTALGSASYQGTLQLSPLRPDGVLSVRNLTYGGIEPLTMTASLSSTPTDISVVAEQFWYAGSRFRALRGSVSLTDTPTSAFTVELGAPNDSRLEIATTHASDGTLHTAQVDARRVEPQRLVEIQTAVFPGLALPDISMLPREMVVDTRIAVDLTEGLVVDVPLFYAFDAARPDDHVSFSLDYDDGSVEVRDLTARYEGYRGSGDFFATIENGGAIRFTSDVVVEDIPYEFAGRFEPGNSLEISGLHDVDARFYFGERGELIFRARGDIPLPIAGSEESRLAFSGDGFFFDRDDWSVDVARLVASGIPYASVPSADIGLAGTFNPSGATLSRLTYDDDFSVLDGRGDLAWDLDAIAGSIELVLTGGEDTSEESGIERYEIAATYSDDELGVDATVQRLPLLRLGVETVRGAVNGSVQLEGPLDALSSRIRGTLVNGKFNTDPIELAATVELDPQTVRIVEASGRYVRSRAENVTGSLSIEDGELDLSGTFVQPDEDGGFSVGLQAAGRFAGLTEMADAVSADFDGTVRLIDLPVAEDMPADWTFDVRRADGTTSAEGGPSQAIRVGLGADGSFRARVADPLPLHFESVGFLEGGSIEADLINVRADVADLLTVIASPDFALTGGTATGSLRIVGPLNDPDFYGTLVAEDVTARVAIIPDVLGPARTFVVFDEKAMTVRRTSVPVETGQAVVSVEAILDRWLPEQFKVAINTVEDGAVRVTNDFGGVRVDGVARGEITIAGDRSAISITGDVSASSTDITLSEQTERLVSEQEQADTRIDITVRTGRGVQFFWPTGAFPILRGSADVGEAVRITYESASESFSLTGEVEIQGGEVFYFDRSFYIREGRITFDENEREFDPLLTVNAEIREVTDEGPLRVYLVADERPLSEFTPRWRSDPPLSEAAILALLGGNVFVSESGQPIDLSEAVLLTSDLVSQFGIIRGFESSVRDALQLDLFSIRTQLFQNLLRGVIDQGEEYPLDNRVPSLGQYLDNTTLFMGKYLGTDLFLELLVQLRATEPSAVEPRSLAGIEVESEFGLEWQTPFFLLEWSFFPRDPSSLFLSDNTISFSWEYTY